VLHQVGRIGRLPIEKHRVFSVSVCNRFFSIF
jgi:hypothetical protein